MEKNDLSNHTNWVDPLKTFLDHLARIPEGFSMGQYRGDRYKIIHIFENNGKIEKLYGENLRRENHISFNLYRLSSRKTLLKPCEMSVQKVQDFVEQVELLKD